MRLEASDPTFIDVLITPNAGRNDRLDRIDSTRTRHMSRRRGVSVCARRA